MDHPGKIVKTGVRLDGVSKKDWGCKKMLPGEDDHQHVPRISDVEIVFTNRSLRLTINLLRVPYQYAKQSVVQKITLLSRQNAVCCRRGLMTRSRHWIVPGGRWLFVGRQLCKGSDLPNKRHVVLPVLSVGPEISVLRHIVLPSKNYWITWAGGGITLKQDSR